ncbi:MAG: SH3 domain-containing protein [Spirochaetaceae bacterium]|nr:SH3 domain-containing protein [Spirochaetaceae bacterium]
MRKVIFIVLLSFLFNSIFSNEFEQRIKGKFWLAGYYNVILQEKNRDIFLEHVPRFREKPREFDEIFYDMLYWYENPSALIFYGKLSLGETRSGGWWIDIQEITFYISDIYKFNEDNYKIILKEKEYIDQRTVDKAAYEGGVLSHVLGKEIEALYFKFDGDYLYIYLEDEKTLLATYYAYTATEELVIRDAVRTNRFDMSRITFPRHADGSSDYEETESPTPEGNTAMIVTENLKLRDEADIEAQVITVMQAGTRVEILDVAHYHLIQSESEGDIFNYWVFVEVQAGAKDRDGKPIREGTVGWCFAEYLEWE